MGKKKVFTLGTENEEESKAKRAVQLEQKKLREGKKSGKAPGMGGGQRVVDTTAESLAELEVIEAKAADSVPESEKTKSKKQVKIRSKAYQTAKAKVDPLKTYSLPDGLKLLREVSLAKFDGTVELHLTTKDIGGSFNIELPHSTGKDKIIAIATDETIAKIEKGDLNFTVLLATPSQMPKLVKLAKVLGPKGLMPNPKNGTVVPDPEAAAKKLSQSSMVTLKTEKSAPVIHTIVGKLSFTDKDLTTNIQAILSVVKPIKSVLKSTISPAIKIIA